MALMRQVTFWQISFAYTSFLAATSVLLRIASPNFRFTAEYTDSTFDLRW